MDEQFQLLLRKGVYPYEYVDDWEKFEESHLLQLRHSTANSACPELVSATTAMLREFGESLGWQIWETITISILRLMCYCCVMSLRLSELPAYSIMPSIPLNFTPLPDWLGKPALRKPRLAWSF